MLSDKEQKKVFKEITSKEPDKYFPTKELRELGYMRKQCSCGTYFWTIHKDREVCGDPACSGGFQVVVDNPSPIKLSFVEVWLKIVEVLEPRGYKPIKRYPCVARWNPTSEFTIASISAFQPYVITGEVEPPAKKLIIPQFCLRFNDIENVGITGSHCTGFVMIGQHLFVPPEEWHQGELFMDMHDFIHIGVGLAKEEITIHEDSWAGGGSFGCSLEFFSRGVELFNQVYTSYEQTPDGPRELKLKVLDMGLGQERVAWFSQGTPNMYEAIFPYVLSKLRKITEIELNLDLYNKFSKYSAYLNIDEVEDLDAAWKEVADKLYMKADDLREAILPMTALYSIAEHSRSLLFAINDGMLPSNTGGGYNLRVIFRRAISFIDKFNWNVDMADVCIWHAEELKDFFPEVSEHLDEIRQILDVEKDKYYKTKEDTLKEIERILKEEKEITTDILVEKYDSMGISPDMFKEAARQKGISIKIPDNFYNLVVERHERVEQIHATGREIDINLENVPETKSLYYYNYKDIKNDAKVLKIFKNIEIPDIKVEKKEKKKTRIVNLVILDKTVVYPTSGGQLHDIGTINGQKFIDAFKQTNYTIHVLEDTPNFKEGDSVEVNVDKDWRTQLSQHHTATHIVNAAARDILGSHINQAGAKKTLKNSHLDVTHFEQISREDLLKIEKRANEIVKEAIDLKLSFIPRTEAELQYGMGLYQGGAVPGKNIRVVEVPGVDVEACGGTHLNNTSETGEIKIIKSQKIQDGIVRLIFTAGEATKKVKEEFNQILEDLKSILNVEESLLIGRASELFDKWKNVNKALKMGKINDEDLILTSAIKVDGDPLYELSQLLEIKESLLPTKIQKLLDEWNENKSKASQMQDLLSEDSINELVDNAENYKGYKLIIKQFENLDQKDLRNFSIKVVKHSEDLITVFLNKTRNNILITGMLATKPAKDQNIHLGNIIKNVVENFGGKGGGRNDNGQGSITNPEQDINEVMDYIKNTLNKN